MSRISKIVTWTISYLVGLALFAAPAYAVVLTVNIQTLPTYVNTNDFKVSCTTNGTSAQFYYSKHGGSFTAFGPLIDLTTDQCVAQVSSSFINDETDYSFKVVVEGNSSGVTTTNYDHSGPSPVSGYYKERVNDGLYKLHFRTPSNGDFDSVIIYRGDTFDFSADGSHKIAQVSGGADSDMTYNDNFSPDPNKTYFYDLRAIDKAGNSSSLVGDGETTTVYVTPTPGAAGTSGGGTTGSVTQLPAQEGQGGSVLGAEVTPTPEAMMSEETPEVMSQSVSPLTWVMTHKKISLGVLAVLAVAGYFFFFRKRSNLK